ncbi:MAG TPA: translesion error-prone DNA polymerase V autoproteolytic subunit [Gammaproteobacteria bacterium]|nr:translesion error-prone DNA polymerase V autoproteolytic subunit [Gammaproteobacteria bacterium]
MIGALIHITPKHVFSFPLYSSSVAAGFPSPADDYIENSLDLNELLIKHPTATFFVRASGNSMLNAGIHDQDILIVDRSLTPVSGRIVIAAIDGQLTVKRLQTTTQGKVLLLPENEDFPPIEIKPESEVHIWGVVTNVIHPV